MNDDIANNEERSQASASDQDTSTGSRASGNNGGSSTTGDTPSDSTGAHSNDQTMKGQLGKRETEHVNRLRYFVLASLFAAAVGVSVLVFLISSHAEEEQMNAEFQAASARLVEAFDGIRTRRTATLASLAVAAIAHGVDHSRDWPFVSLSSFQQRAYTARKNAGVLQVSINPLVKENERVLWEEYVVSNEAQTDWIERTMVYQDQVGADVFIEDYGTNFRGNVSQPHAIMRRDAATGEVAPLKYGSKKWYLPFWEISPFLSFNEVNVDMVQEDDRRSVLATLALEEGKIVIGDLEYSPPGGIESQHATTSAYAQILSIDAGEKVDYLGDPMSSLFIPIFDSFEDGRVPTGLLVGLFNWGSLFTGVLPETIRGIDVVLHEGCGNDFTFQVIGEDVIPVGRGDLHDRNFDAFMVVTDKLEVGTTADGTKTGLAFAARDCYYSLSIYPSDLFADDYQTATPWVLVVAVAGVLLFSIGMFFVYDHLVERRQSLVLRKAVQSTAIVSSLFPKNVRDRLMNATSSSAAGVGGDEGDPRTISAFRDRLRNKKASMVPPIQPMFPTTTTTTTELAKKNFSADDFGETIADLFPNCTVLFADIAGFTAWSSTRDPSQVFTLLQNLYQAFDKVALRRRVFKVETIGDSYVAVTGLPEPQEAHAVIMAKFARDCLLKMHEVTSALELRLGPDTCDLAMRFGLNSGQVTGGVLRGDRARFQLFGDTVNTAARMESTGERGRIQLSPSTAELLMAAGKQHWVKPRQDAVTAKGKGVMHTFWLEMDKPRAELCMNVSSERDDMQAVDNKSTHTYYMNNGSTETVNSTIMISKQETRLIGWMTEVLLDYVKQIVAKNIAFGIGTDGGIAHRHTNDPDTICLDEVVESFALPKENPMQVAMVMEQYRQIELDPAVVQELHAYVTEISFRYHDRNPFHNFAHACHVTMSVHKLMKRVVNDGTDGLAVESTTTATSSSSSSRGGSSNCCCSESQNQHDHTATYGILTSDPLTLFAIVFSGLIHDVDHPGVSNMQLNKEQPELAKHYRHKSVAEQNSFDIAWTLLMSESYDTLRRTIFPTVTDLMRFRQVVVNTVLATDIFDKEMGDMRKARWDRVFGGNSSSTTTPTPTTAITDDGLKDGTQPNTRATIVLEHIIQASDVSHTMQHWHVYTKWNRRLFEELRLAFRQGRMVQDPAMFWYEGELGFFDNYVIPLAKKLQECHVFGVSSDEYLNYALSNRNEWEAKGKLIVQEMDQNNPSQAMD